LQRLARPHDEAALRRSILYCCGAPVEPALRLPSVAGRMQRLSGQASLDFASTLTERPSAESPKLEPLWNELLSSPRWATVLNQYPLLRQVRALMVHPREPLVATGGMADGR
jgi:hypothetical protein